MGLESIWQSVCDKMPLAAIVCGATAEVLYANRSALDMLDVPGELEPPAWLRDLLLRSSDDNLELHDAILPLIHDGLNATVEGRLIGVSGDTRSVRVRITSLGEQRAGESLITLEIVDETPPFDYRPPESAHQYRALLDASTDAVFLETLDGRILDCNASACEMYGYTEAELRQLSAADLVPEDVRSSLSDMIADQLAEDGLLFEATGVRNNGEAFPTEVSTRLLHTGDEALVAVYVRDITRRKQVAEELRQSSAEQEELSSIIHNSPAVAIRWRRDAWDVEYVSDSIMQWGYTPEDLLSGRVCYGDIIHPDDAERVMRLATAVGQGTAREFSSEYRIRTADGGVRWVDDRTWAPIGSESGGRRSVILDVTSRQLAEQALRESERRFREAFENVELIAVALDLAGNVTFCNDALLELSGHQRDEVMGREWFGLFIPEDMQDEMRTVFTQSIHSGQITPHYENPLVTSTGELRLVRWNNTTLRDLSGRPIGTASIGEDITERKRAENALLEAKETAWALLNATSDMALLLDADLQVVATNDAMAKSLARSASDLIGSCVLNHLDKDTAARRVAFARQAIRTGRPVRFEDHRGGKDFVTAMYPVSDATGTVTQLAVFAQDITHRKRAQEAQRLAAIGQLATGVAHEFNNLLAGVLLGAELAAGTHSLEAYEKLTDVVLALVPRGSEICKNLLAFARPREPKRALTHIEAPIEEALKMVAHHVGVGGVVVKRDYNSEGKRVYVDTGQLQQVFLNLFLNACHAMRNGGCLTVTTRHTPGSSDAGVVAVQVADTGSGIRPADLPHIFEPFFTTKKALGNGGVEGTGLGLSVSRRILSAHGAEIDVASDADSGTTFTIRFAVRETEPAAEWTTDVMPIDGGQAAPTGGRILVAEDRLELRGFIAEALGGWGYHVATAESATAAIAAAEKTDFDLVITDMVMPGGGGKAVLEALSKLPDPPAVLAIAGIIDEDTMAEAVTLGASECLRKPFALEELMQAVQRVLVSKPGEGDPVD